MGQAILVGSDLELDWEKLLDYYSLRFQIELRLSGGKTTFRVGRFYDDDESRSRKCDKFIVFDGQWECENVKNGRRKMCRDKRPEKSYSGSKIRGESNKNTSRKT